MTNLSVYVFALFFLALTSCSMGMTPEQKAIISQHFHEIGMECIKEHAITADDITNIKAKKEPTGPNAPCFLACVFRNTGVMDSSGKMQSETALELAKNVFSDPEELKAIADYMHSCSHVNNEPVGDGDKGCERAILSFKCMTENAAQFGFDI